VRALAILCYLLGIGAFFCGLGLLGMVFIALGIAADKR